MYNLGQQFKLNMERAQAKHANVVAGNKYRFTVLTPRVIRMEYSPSGVFTDMPTELIWYRDLPNTKFKVNESKLQNANVYEYIISHGRGIVEEFITQHPTTAAFNSKSCNSMRIVTMNLNNEFKILGGVFRVGIDNEFDNWSAGGIIAGLDIKTGKINTDGSDKNGHKFIVHPNSKIKFKGYQIPCWKKVVKALEEASKMLPKMPYIGWDVVITDQEEVEFIEGNHNHDITILQAPYGILENKGVKYLIEPYITEGVEMKD